MIIQNVEQIFAKSSKLDHLTWLLTKATLMLWKMPEKLHQNKRVLAQHFGGDFEYEIIIMNKYYKFFI